MVARLPVAPIFSLGVVLSTDLPFLVSSVEQTCYTRMITPLTIADALRLRCVPTVVGPLLERAAYSTSAAYGRKNYAIKLEYPPRVTYGKVLSCVCGERGGTGQLAF